MKRSPPSPSRPRLPWIALLALMLSTDAFSFEPWLAPGLAVVDGAEFIFDAASETAARRAAGLPIPEPGMPLAIWHDASGLRRDCLQRLGPSAPTYQGIGGPASGACFVRFDGVDDCLQWAGPPSESRGATLIMLAAPRANAGMFRAFAALNRRGRNDYMSGLNMDMGLPPSAEFAFVNVEGPGFGGAPNMLREASAFGAFRILSATVPSDQGRVALHVDGRIQKDRPRDAWPIAMDELTIGARFYSNTPIPARLEGFFDGDIAAVAIYSRALPDDERAAVEAWMRARYAPLFRIRGVEDSLEKIIGDEAHLSLHAEPPGAPEGPPIQFLAPGFAARELPIELSNINNLLYREDGSLMALGYNGAVYRLTDTNDDGLEDRVETFWPSGKLRGPIGMALTPPGYRDGFGVFVASKGKVSLILDRDGDNRADEEKIVATGWKEIPPAVDALGVALDVQGNVFFGLGTTDYSNAYLVDRKTGEAHYDLASERGTIQKISPDFTRRETVCTGVRFSVSVKFNARGDLFCTDQEGQTWLPGGNPFDELLHILPGRHYGFPPKHEKFLPQVFDEPSTCDIGPEHQSTCGLCFNEAPEGKPIFGPEAWRGSAFIAGYSRGKLYRAQLNRGPEGYVARNHVFASVGMPLVEVALSPSGTLRLACHTGQPDWGSGPEGDGKLFEIAWVDREAPQPIAAWAEGPLEARVAFDRPLPPESLARLREGAEIACGKYVRAGDPYEAFRPGYQLVQEQMFSPRRRLEISGMDLADGGMTLVIATQPHPSSDWYALRLANPFGDADEASATIDLDYRIGGAQLSWTPAEGATESAWKGWAPHPDMETSIALLAGSARGGEIARRAKQPGKFKIECMLDLPPGENELRFAGAPVLSAAIGDRNLEPRAGEKSQTLLVSKSDGGPLPSHIEFATGAGAAPSLSHRLPGDKNLRPIALDRAAPPWAPPPAPAETSAPQIASTGVEKGNWLRGKRIFFGEAKCSQCHQIRGEGRAVGPDLSNLIYRDAGSVLRDIRQPSAAINPDFVTYNVRLADGEEIASVLRTEPSGAIHAFDNAGEERLLRADQILEYRASGISTMPEGLDLAVGEKGLGDLLAFLLDPPPLMPADLAGAPPPRSKAEVEAALGISIEELAERKPTSNRPLRIVLVAGPKDHGPGEHDYPNWQRVWERLLKMAENVEVSTAWEFPTDGDFEKADVLVFYFWFHAWSADRAAQFDRYLERGGGMVFLHSAVIPNRDHEALAERIGLAARMGATGYRHGPIDLAFKIASEHPIIRRLKRAQFVDESYWPMLGDAAKIEVLAEGEEEGKPRPLMWTFERGKGRVIASILGHYSWTFDDPIFRTIILRGIAWAAGEPAERLEPLALAGVGLRGETQTAP